MIPKSSSPLDRRRQEVADRAQTEAGNIGVVRTNSLSIQISILVSADPNFTDIIRTIEQGPENSFGPYAAPKKPLGFHPENVLTEAPQPPGSDKREGSIVGAFPCVPAPVRNSFLFSGIDESEKSAAGGAIGALAVFRAARAIKNGTVSKSWLFVSDDSPEVTFIMRIPGKNILVTGSSGQIGSELVPALRRRHGKNNVIACDIKRSGDDSRPFELADATDSKSLERMIRKHRIGSIYHLVSILSAVGEQNPNLAWSVNVGSLRNVLDLAVRYRMEKVFWPSSIAAFGPHTPRTHTHQLTVMDPSTMYGITKVAGELLCNYTFTKYGIDVRCLRFPGIISWKTPPGGGTTDYAVAIFHGALRGARYECFVSADTVIPMMYMPDAIRATLEFMAVPCSRLRSHLGYNLSAMTFSAGELAREVKRRVPGFVCAYKPDERQQIADSWPKSIDDRCSRQDWGWKPRFDLHKTADDMLKNLRLALRASHAPVRPKERFPSKGRSRRSRASRP